MNQENLNKFNKCQQNYDNMEHPQFFEDDASCECECCGLLVEETEIIVVLSTEIDPDDRCEMKVCDECEEFYIEL